ncbi:MAG: hypothetical protein LBG12_02775 [Synergistaceae bacterium]|jgi:hypothetical protein|nr:hypothetical protein [Synergistaceae bacterium]
MRETKEAFNAALQITLACITARQGAPVDKNTADEVNEFFETIFQKLNEIYKTTIPEGPVIHPRNS